MSCTENESGPFVVYFLPAVVGCLTILLARRWANSQVSNTSSTAISRRRKIIKDPLIKRPLPPIACKMVPPLQKKAAGVAKKGTYSLLDEDTFGNGKRLHRPSRESSTVTSSPDIRTSEGQVSPKHIPFPYIPQDGDLLFDAMTFVFVVVATGLQYINIYRTAWWLPHLQAAESMNFYLIDPNVVAFILAILLRRLLFSVTVAVLRAILDPKDMPAALVSARIFVLGILAGGLGWCAYFIIIKYPPIKIFYLCYPTVIYLLLFGFQIGPFLELSSGQPVFHSCSSDPELITAEVEAMRTEFNQRASRILFNSIVEAYYSSFIPCCFAQPFVHYDVYGAVQQVCLVWAGLCARYGAQLGGAARLDAPHRAAMHLATTTLTSHTATASDAGAETERSWIDIKYWVTSSAKDGNTSLRAQHMRFYAVFKNPSTLLCMVLCMQLSLIVLQLCLLFSSVPWNTFVSTLILLFINYYTLFKLMRDYLVAWKVYKAESMIREKNVAVLLNNPCVN